MPGSDAPVYQLWDMKESPKSLNEFTGKYVYLHFAATWSFPCTSEFDAIEKFYLKNKNKIEVVTVFADLDTSAIHKFLNQHDYDWTFLYCKGNSEMLKRYNVKTYPTCYLIDPDGKLQLSPAPGITERFEGIFARIIENK